MKAVRRRVWGMWLLCVGLAVASGHAELVINEVLFNPPGTDVPFQYIELRGTPNLVIPNGTCLLAIEGDSGNNPGTVQSLFDLSGRAVGGNSFLVLLQKTNGYSPNPSATILVNTNSGAGWGSGATSSVGHHGNGGRTDLKHPSVSFFLIQTTSPPKAGDDLDPGNTGVLNPSVTAGWIILDSVGVLDADGAGDVAYGAINFRLSSSPGNAASATGTVVPIGFVPKYIGRTGNTSGSGMSAWGAGDVQAGSGSNWVLGAAGSVAPAWLAGAALNHLGAPNFGAAAIPGVVVGQPQGGIQLVESGGNSSYTLGLNTQPTGQVTIQVACGPQLEVSTDGGSSFGACRTLVLSNQVLQTVAVRALADSQIDLSPHRRCVTNSVVATADPSHYPVFMLPAMVQVDVWESHPLLLSELKVNPPGSSDGPYEYIEIQGAPSAVIGSVYFLAIEGDNGNNPGSVTYAVNLAGTRLGSSGLLAVVATNAPYLIPGSAATIKDPLLSQPDGALDNGTVSFLLVFSPTAIRVGDDLDSGNNGILEGLPPGAAILDAVAWSDGDKNDIVYGGVDLTLDAGTPDGGTRFPGNETANCAAAWFCGDLVGPDGGSLVYNADCASSNFPPYALMSPGVLNNTAPVLSSIVPVSGVIGDASNPTIRFTVWDRETVADRIVVTASSTNAGVVPGTNLHVTTGAGGERFLRIDPVGVGYSEITLFATDGSLTGRVSFPYAASAPGGTGTVWHLGASDGSTAVPVDADYMVLGDDENQRLRLYPRRYSSVPLAQYDMSAFLALPDAESGLPREVDIEASTHVGNRLFWLGSLGHAADGEPRTNRTRIFATDLTRAGAASSLAYVGRYDYLKLDLIQWDSANLHGKGTNYYGLAASDAAGVPPKAPDGSGFAVEGLSVMPSNSAGGYIAFRAPIVPATNRNYALVVPILNLTLLAASGGPPGSCVFGPPIELDLYGRGVRSIEGDANGYLLVAGAPGTAGPYPQDFKLYTWSGNPADAPQERTADLSAIGPEGIVELPAQPWTPATTVELLTDNGSTVFYGDDIKAKALAIPNFKKCRSDLVALGSVTKPVPYITSTALKSGVLTIQWRALKGETYQLQSASELASGNWSDLSAPVVATGPRASLAVSAAGSRRFFRLVLR